MIGAVRVSIRAHAHTHTHEVKSSSGTHHHRRAPLFHRPSVSAMMRPADNGHTRWALTLSHLVQPRPPPHPRSLALDQLRPARPSPLTLLRAAAIFLSTPLTPFGAPWQMPQRRRWVATASLSERIICGKRREGGIRRVWRPCSVSLGHAAWRHQARRRVRSCFHRPSG